MNFILQSDGEAKNPQQCSQETYPSCCNQLGIKSSFSRQCIFCSPATIYFLPSDICFCKPCSYLELHISKGSCSTTPPKTASKFLFVTTDISFYLHTPFTLDWKPRFHFNCSFTFALEMESPKNFRSDRTSGCHWVQTPTASNLGQFQSLIWLRS